MSIIKFITRKIAVASAIYHASIEARIKSHRARHAFHVVHAGAHASYFGGVAMHAFDFYGPVAAVLFAMPSSMRALTTADVTQPSHSSMLMTKSVGLFSPVLAQGEGEGIHWLAARVFGPAERASARSQQRRLAAFLREVKWKRKRAPTPKRRGSTFASAEARLAGTSID